MISEGLKGTILEISRSKKLDKNNSYLDLFAYLNYKEKEEVKLFLNENHLKESEPLQLLLELGDN